MKIDLNGILEGLNNRFLSKGEFKKQVEAVYEERMKVCEGCEWNSKNQDKVGPVRCLKCGCTLSLKGRCLSCECPLHSSFPEKYWGPVISKTQEADILEKMKEDDNI